ncbi:MAG: hypothetical protein INR71_09505, partial [Terriglobus roseus]|nr:hypothetical protein [Terriglobus roseus]
AAAQNGPAAGLAPRETQKAVVGALEQIVSSVAADVRVENADGDDAEPERNTSSDAGSESALRAGIRRWMNELDEGSLQVR